MSSQIQCLENKFANGVKDSNPILAPVPTPPLAPIANENYITLKPSSWKQGYDRFRIYFFLKGVEKEKIEAEFEPQSCDVKIHDFKGKSYRCTIPKLHKEILPEKCTVLVRPTRVVISLFKASEEISLDVVEHVCPPLPTPNLVPIVNGVKLPRNRALKYVMLKPFNWYQDKHTVKIYIYLEGVERENVEVEFKPMSFDVRFHEVKGKNYRCFVPELINEILTEKCTVVVWSIRIEITLVKASEGIWKDLQLSKEHVSTSFPTPTLNTALNAVNVSSNRALNILCLRPRENMRMMVLV